MIINLFGYILIGAAVYIFKLGIEYDSSDYGYLAKVRLIGASFLVLLLGAAFLATSKSFCEVFGVFC